MAHFYIANTHFHDAMMVNMLGRPYRSIAEHDAALTEAICKAVERNDDLWILGSFAAPMGADERSKLAWTLARLPGRKRLVAGPQDGKEVRSLDWYSTHEMIEVQDGDARFFLCHYPLAVWNGQRAGVRQLYGHVHRGMPGSANSLNVGIEEIGATPIGREQILARMADLGRAERAPEAA